ncbi:tetratricopeptide repeat protein [Marinilabilia salmonicolor]|uniref:Tetratricopeptide repeat protein n=1 Tax=Marinilabilia salmonicolor TaxID=989 RepID=A0A368UP92_9BACT|nr:tetratricopeptide repeat protein [Marinilabilia salmonicolor]RCW26117.1 tetratricopeptide repeat protein [Marinilabilia salmonicolor]
MIKRYIFSVFILFFAAVFFSAAQESYDVRQPERLFDEALEQYRNERYGLARSMFENLEQKFAPGQSNLKAESAYYAALSASMLENEDAEDMLEAFLIDYPESGMRPYVYKRLGDMEYEEGKYRQAGRQYRYVDARKLDRETRIDFRFKSGYCHFVEGENEQALSAFSEIRNVDSEWWGAANYYYAHIQYEQGNYNAALSIFEKLKDEPGFGAEVPFYITQIYYLQEEYRKAIEYGVPLVKEARGTRKGDMAQAVGNAYYAVNDYDKAAEYLSLAVDLVEEPPRQDYYHLGMSFYHLKEYENAAGAFSQVTGKKDVMAQNAFFHLGDCHLKLNDKKRARVAFEAASEMEYDLAITEEAMFNYIKLNYELSFSPFNEIIDSFTGFIDRFPESRYIDEAWQYLGQALLTSRNYKQALEALEQVKNKTADNYRALQRIAYHRGLELFNNLRFDQAIDMLQYSLQYGEYDRDLKVKARYWLGEAYYRQARYNKAIENFDIFIRTPGSYGLEEFNTAHYNIGYAWFKQKNYDQAASWFRKYENLMGSRQNPMLGDALNRIGDSFFMKRDFSRAISYYERATNVPGTNADYAMYQKAFAMGIDQNHRGKIEQLEELVDRYPESSYVDDAYYEMGRSYVALNDLTSAIRMYKTIKEQYPRSNFSKKAMLQLGLVYYNSDDLDQSLAFYKRVVNEFPGTPEAEDALLGIRNIYLDRNDADGFIAYSRQVGGFASIDERQEDSLSYVTAEKLYMQNKCLQAINQFESYLRKYPNGRFAVNAHFYKADCQFRNEDYENARQSFEFVASRPGNIFMEDALIGVARISYHQERYEDALGYYERLEMEAEKEESRREALIGQMRCLGKMDDRPGYVTRLAERVLADAKTSPEVAREARYLKANAHLELGETDLALEEFQSLKVNPSSPEGAEARYRVADILYQRNNIDKAEEEIFDFVNVGTPHQYWIARCFLLLADIYENRGELFQARQYIESLLENYKETDDDIRQRANKRLNELEKAQSE